MLDFVVHDDIGEKKNPSNRCQIIVSCVLMMLLGDLTTLK